MSAPETMKTILQEAKVALTASEISERAQNTLGESITTNNISVSASRSLDVFYTTSSRPQCIGLVEFLHDVVKSSIIKLFIPKSKLLTARSFALSDFQNAIKSLLAEINSDDEAVSNQALEILKSLVGQEIKLLIPRKKGPREGSYLLSFDDNGFRLCNYSSNSITEELKQQNDLPNDESPSSAIDDSSMLPVDNDQNKGKKKREKNDQSEKALYPLVQSFVAHDPHFTCFSITINAQGGKNATEGTQKWGFPDMAGVSYPFGPLRPQDKDGMEPECLALAKRIGSSTIVLFSFEVKVDVCSSNLKEYYFQAVSNSSWANEGYLVAAYYKDLPSMIDEMQRLSNAFGIGFIQLDLDDFSNSKVLIPARYREELDWITINKLVKMTGSSNFREFINSINEIYSTYELGVDSALNSATFEGKYGKILSEEKVRAHIERHRELLEKRVPYLKQMKNTGSDPE